MVSEWGIYYDPDPQTTVIKEDEELIFLYKQMDQLQFDESIVCRWVLRFKISSEVKFDENF